MSDKRSRNARITDDQITNVINKLHQLIPELRHKRSNKVSTAELLQETCKYIKNLHREIDDLSQRLSELLASVDSESSEAAIIRNLFV